MESKNIIRKISVTKWILVLILGLAVCDLQGQGNRASAEMRVVTGTVVDANKAPLPGVIIRVSNIAEIREQFPQLNNISAISSTDIDGKFRMNLPSIETPVTLHFSYLGLKPVIYNVRKDLSTIQITMEESSTDLSEVVVTGMEVINKDRMTGAVSVITAKDIKDKGLNSIDRILEGMVPGLNSTTVSGAPGARAKITIRGQNNLSGNTEPLWIVDGLPLLDGVPSNENSGDFAGTIMQDGVGNIMPEDIESITILKDASAAALYGANAANGVIVITTKKGFRSKANISYNGTFAVSSAPDINLGFMNSSEKLIYEKSIVDNYGLNYARYAGRGGYLYERHLRGYYTKDEYNDEIQKLSSTNTDWFDVIFRNSLSQQHSLNIRGGSEELSYYTSVNVRDQRGILKTNDYSNMGAVFKLDYRPSEKLIFDFGISANTVKNASQASGIDPFKYAVFANPYERPYDANGNYAADLSYLANNRTAETESGYLFDTFNILREMNNTQNLSTGLDVNTTINIQYKILPTLKATFLGRKSYSYNTSAATVNPGTYASWRNDSFNRIAFQNQDLLPARYDNGQINENSGKSNSWSVRGQLDYSFKISDNHLFSVFAASEATSRSFNNFGYTSPMYISDYRIVGIPSYPEYVTSLTYDNMRSAISSLFYTSDRQERLVSFMGLLRYSYQDRYVVNFNYRADGADIIGDGEKFTPLWSLGGRYNLHKEKFFENDIVNELSFRGSYGFTGKIDRTAYPFSTISYGTELYQGNFIASGFQYPNPTVKWEKKEDRNLGIDMSLFKSRIMLNANYYNNRTKDLLSNLTVPVSTGRTSVKANGGIVVNKGYEIGMTVRWINKSDLSFATTVNIGRNKNIIEKALYTNAYSDYYSAVASSPIKGGVINIVGQETGGVYGWKTAGINPETGNPRYYLTNLGKIEYAKFLDSWNNLGSDRKSFYEGIIKDFNSIPEYIDYVKEDGVTPDFYRYSLQYLGSLNPKLVGGFNTSLQYKNLLFTTSWTFKTGHIVPVFNDYMEAPRNVVNLYADVGYTSDIYVSSTNRLKEYTNYWQAIGDETNIGRFTRGNDVWLSSANSDRYEKGDYLRLGYLSLSYNIPNKFSQKLGLTRTSVSFLATNLVTFTKYRGIDVATQSTFGYPVSRDYNIKLTVGF